MSFIEPDTEKQKDTKESNTTELVIVTLFQIWVVSLLCCTSEYFWMSFCYQLMNYQAFEINLYMLPQKLPTSKRTSFLSKIWNTKLNVPSEVEKTLKQWLSPIIKFFNLWSNSQKRRGKYEQIIVFVRLHWTIFSKKINCYLL